MVRSLGQEPRLIMEEVKMAKTMYMKQMIASVVWLRETLGVDWKVTRSDFDKITLKHKNGAKLVLKLKESNIIAK